MCTSIYRQFSIIKLTFLKLDTKSWKFWRIRNGSLWWVKKENIDYWNSSRINVGDRCWSRHVLVTHSSTNMSCCQQYHRIRLTIATKCFLGLKPVDNSEVGRHALYIVVFIITVFILILVCSWLHVAVVSTRTNKEYQLRICRTKGVGDRFVVSHDSVVIIIHDIDILLTGVN